jgi:hypothetical protein
VQMRCPSTAGVVADLCGPTVNPRIGTSPGTRRREDQGHVVGLDVWPLHRRAFVVIQIPLSLL